MKCSHTRPRRRRSLLLGSAALIAGLGLVAATSSAGKADPSKSAGSTTDEKRILQKLDQILENQTQILQRLDAVMEELRIVKIRATQKQ